MIKAYLNTNTFVNHYDFYVIDGDRTTKLECPSNHIDSLIHEIAFYISQYKIKTLMVDNEGVREVFFPAIKQQLQNEYNYNDDFSMEVKE